jgi:PHP family Zn ribbon phosphoesterase
MLPKESKKYKNLCPKCKKELTVGVLHRVDDLADRLEKDISNKKFIPHKYIVPLREIISEALGVGVKSKKVESEYKNMISKIGNEFYILLEAPLDVIKNNISNKNILSGIKNMRAGKVKRISGFDGQYGKIITIY